jgi:hypothetical protein
MNVIGHEAVRNQQHVVLACGSQELRLYDLYTVFMGQMGLSVLRTEGQEIAILTDVRKVVQVRWIRMRHARCWSSLCTSSAFFFRLKAEATRV